MTGVPNRDGQSVRIGRGPLAPNLSLAKIEPGGGSRSWRRPSCLTGGDSDQSFSPGELQPNQDIEVEDDLDTEVPAGPYGRERLGGYHFESTRLENDQECGGRPGGGDGEPRNP